jgi:hypothetical protein
VRLADYYLGDPRLVLIPIEHLSRDGMSAAFAALLGERCGWSPGRVELFNAAFALYWERSRILAHSRSWGTPRLRHVVLVRGPLTVRPYAQLLNTSAWLLYENDFDPEASHAEFAAYLLVHGDRMAQTGEVTMAAVRDAAYWFDRTDAERAAFTAAAERSSRPDADAFRALAKAIDWLRELRHETLRPPLVASPHRPIPGTGLLVPRQLDAEPPRLVERWTKVAERALKAYRARWAEPDAKALSELCDRLTASPPRLLVAERGHVVWDPEQPAALGKLRAILKQADGSALRTIAADLEVVDRHTRHFFAALANPEALPPPAPGTEQKGYVYLHRTRGLVTYDLRETGMERLQGPDLPFARAMLGARTMHEWAHLAATAGWVPRTVDDARFAELVAAFAAELDATIAAAPRRVRAAAAPDLEVLAQGRPLGAALAGLFLKRIDDYQSNLVAWPFLADAERETYVRHNVRTLRPFFRPNELWRMLIRYLYEYQYLGLSVVEDKRTYFLRSTWFDVDFFAAGALDEARFDALAAAARALCTCHAVDTARIRLPSDC